MSMPCLHSASVGTSVPSISIRARSKNAAGCRAQTRGRTLLMMSINVCTSAALKRRQKSPGRGRIGNALGVEGVEVDFILTPQFEVLQASAIAQGVVGQVENVIG